MTVQAKATSSAPSKSTNNPKNARSGPAARRKAIRAAIRAIGASKTITSVWEVLADLGAFAADGWAEATYDGLVRQSKAKKRMAMYAVRYGEAIGLLAVEVRRPVRGGPNLPNRYRFTLDTLPGDPSAVESFSRWLARQGATCTLKPRVQVAPGSERTRSDRDEVHRRAGHSLSGAEHPQAANAGKNGDGRSGCSAPDGPASFGTGSGRDCEQQARADYRVCAPAAGPAAGTKQSTMMSIRGADQRGEQGGSGMRLIDANEGDTLERGSERVVIRSVERDRNFVTYRRVDGDPSSRTYTATATHDDASEPEHRAASDWTRGTE